MYRPQGLEGQIFTYCLEEQCKKGSTNDKTCKYVSDPQLYVTKFDFTLLIEGLGEGDE